MDKKVDDLRQNAERAKRLAQDVKEEETAVALRIAAEKLNKEAGQIEYDERKPPSKHRGD
jgi:hypothetical protein